MRLLTTLLFVFGFSGGALLWAQRPATELGRPMKLPAVMTGAVAGAQGSKDRQGEEAKYAECDLNDAGQVVGYFGLDLLTSNSFDGLPRDQFDQVLYANAPEQIFLCWQDLVGINLDEETVRLDGDPDGSTTPGVGFGVFTCLPDQPEPENFEDIVSDPCNPRGGADAFAIYYADVSEGPRNYATNPPSYDQLITNGDIGSGQSIQNLFGGGGPLEIFLVPITFDGVDPADQSTV